MTGELDPVSFAADLGLPGIADVHAHFMPEEVMGKVWQVFDNAAAAYGRDWPIVYRLGEADRLGLLRAWGVRAFTSLAYAHKPGMAAWLNEWSRGFAERVPDCLHSATFFPEPSAPEYVREAIDAGARVFKIHLQVGGFDPRDGLLRPVWGMIEAARIPVVFHCASGPMPGRFTGPGPARELLGDFPGLSLIVAHLGAPEYAEFLALADAYPDVRLDSTMVFTDFMQEAAPFPPSLRGELAEAGLRGDVLFGSDFPNIPYSYGHALESLARLDMGDDWLRAVAWESAAALFALAP